MGLGRTVRLHGAAALAAQPPGSRRFPGNHVTERASKMLAEDSSDAGTARRGGTIAFEDAVLVDRCRKGDMQAFGALVAKYQDRIFNMICRMVSRRADAEELAQDTFLKALERISQFRGQSQFYTWLFRIAANLAISYRRRGGRVKFQSLSASEDFEQSQADALTAAMAGRRNPGPDTAVVAAETSRRVLEALEELDDEYRLVVVLCDIEEMDYAQIADVLDVPVGTVKSRLHRARCILRDKLADLADQQTGS